MAKKGEKMELSEKMKNTISYLFGSGGGTSRIKILNLLRSRPVNANMMAQTIDLNYRTVRHHISVLLRAEVIESNTKEDEYGQQYHLVKEIVDNFDEVMTLAYTKVEERNKSRNITQPECTSVYTNCDNVEINVEADKIWVNTDKTCVLRIQNIKQIVLHDSRFNH
jgi:DNA-binding transcriptional ArsR family regulator